MKKLLTSAVAAGTLAMGFVVSATPAQASPPPPSPPACTTSDFTGATIQACEGYFGGNILNSANKATQITELGELGFTWDGSTILQSFSGLGGLNPTFSPHLFGISYLGIHYGNGGGSPDGTAFFRIDAGSGGISTLTLNPPFPATSNLLVYGTGSGGVPEPATWGLMLVGFGGMGALLRRRRAGLAATA
jgi:hypothetical protein